MKQIQYQQKAVKELVDKTIDLLTYSGMRHTLVFKAPTGAGKTVMASEMLLRLNTELRERTDVPSKEVAYIWIAPNKLHEQSYFKMKSFFTEGQQLHPVIFDDLDHSADGYIHPGEILFVNWESINKDNAVMIRDTEQGSSLYDLTRRTQEEQQIPIIVIIDEEHMFAGKLANKSEKVLKTINPKVEIRISATPVTTRQDALVSVPREKVINEGMIKQGVVLNPALEFNDPNGSLNQHLVHLALKKREELAEAYRKIGVNINPLLLIQLPNDKDKMDKDDDSIKEEVMQYLDVVKGINTANGKLAIWLSNEKENLEGIEKSDNLTEVLLFKQAIALGWDCPRAAVLLIFRKIESYTFTAQTVGRILRMPEQHFYEDDRLNWGYVYTNLSKDIIQIVQDDMEYMSNIHAVRRENLCNVVLRSEYCERPAIVRNRLGPDFKKVLAKVFEDILLVKNRQLSLFTIDDLEGNFEDDDETSGNADGNNGSTGESIYAKNQKAVEDKITFKVHSIGIDLVEDLSITGEVGEVHVGKKARYVRTMQELNNSFNAFCAQRIGSQFEKVSVATLGFALKELMEDQFELFETDAVKVILYHTNKPVFIDLIDRALKRYLKILAERQNQQNEKYFKEYDWEVPVERLYKEESHRIKDNVHDHALMPFVELKNASKPEEHFEAFLEANKEHIDWWYKNGDAGRQHYAISYENKAGLKSLFYVDFVIRMKNGQIFLFDTKSAGSDPDAVEKHNALIDYMASEENKDKHLRGGIIIERNSNWKYCPQKIENTTDIMEWDCFYPKEY